MPWPWRKRYRSLNEILVNPEALRYNLKLYRELDPKIAVIPVLKANAYGHGIEIVAKALDSENCPFFAVDSLYEAYVLQKLHLKTPILVLGFSHPENLRRRLPFHFTASDLETAKHLKNLGLPFQLEIETGMKRMGLNWETADQWILKLKKDGIQVKGAWTHLACADEKDHPLTLKQEARFKEVLEKLRAAGQNLEWIHCGGSSGKYRSILEQGNALRVGLGIYGISPYSEDETQASGLQHLEPALSFKSTLVGVQDLQTGESLSYGATYTAEANETIGILGAGYYEGVPRSLSNKGKVEIRGQIASIVGRVCMNFTLIRLPEPATKYQIGETVTIFSSDQSSPCSIKAQAEKAGTIPYELLVKLAESVRRTQKI